MPPSRGLKGRQKVLGISRQPHACRGRENKIMKKKESANKYGLLLTFCAITDLSKRRVHASRLSRSCTGLVCLCFVCVCLGFFLLFGLVCVGVVWVFGCGFCEVVFFWLVCLFFLCYTFIYVFTNLFVCTSHHWDMWVS